MLDSASAIADTIQQLRKLSRTWASGCKLVGLPVKSAWFSTFCAIAKGAAQVGDIAEVLGISHQAAGKTLRDLEAADLITVKVAEGDRRGRVIMLQSDGLEAMSVLKVTIAHWNGAEG